ncbi:MAG: 5-(carboxyamino)imidazole ribonucleotide mutase [Deltaproteobacteria bacterium]|nr:5-(carboxyamino)imidazole ribonucleotide mutase [Deltaproteobacteria bacterium]MCB9488600.1 5-(carboxyamino)imidazole ribonucleotide mutase [Deltaproteobacteria bacterium]
MSKKVAVLMGSDSDFDTMSACVKQLKALSIEHDVRVLSAHRSPDETIAYVRDAEKNGFGVIIAAAGGAAHLAGVCAGACSLPVIGVPMDATPLGGLDALLATVQMPPGVPVATVAVGNFGAHNAAVLAAQILAVGDEALAAKMREHKQAMRESVDKKNAKLQDKLGRL